MQRRAPIVHRPSSSTPFQTSSVLRRVFAVDARTRVHVFQSSGVPADAAVTTYPGPEAAYFSLFHSQPSMDNRAVRLSGVLSFCVAVLCLIFAERSVTEWVVSVDGGHKPPIEVHFCCFFFKFVGMLRSMLTRVLFRWRGTKSR